MRKPDDEATCIRHQRPHDATAVQRAHKVGSGAGSPTRSRHFLRRYYALQQRIAQGEVSLQYVPDEDMPADFLTKWIPRSKLERSIRYATGTVARRVSSAHVHVNLNSHLHVNLNLHLNLNLNLNLHVNLNPPPASNP